MMMQQQQPGGGRSKAEEVGMHPKGNAAGEDRRPRATVDGAAPLDLGVGALRWSAVDSHYYVGECLRDAYIHMLPGRRVVTI